VKVVVGSFNRDAGTVETSPAGLVYTGPDPEHLRRIVEYQREWYDHSGIRHELTDDELLRSRHIASRAASGLSLWILKLVSARSSRQGILGGATGGDGRGE